MKSLRHFGASLFVACITLLVASCFGPFGPVSSNNNPSSALFIVPDSLVGASAARAARTATSDTWVVSSVNGYYEYVRGQIRFGADIAAGIRGLIEELEAVRFGDGFLLDQNVSLLEVTTAAEKYRWQTLSPDNWSLEWWHIDDTKVLELLFALDVDGGYSGSAIINGAAIDWGLAAGLDAPDMVEAVFDSASDGSGTMDVRVGDFRAHADLDDGVAGGEEDLIMLLSRDAAGTVTIGSMAQVRNSRHFVWDGYDYSGVLNGGATAETRYYVAAGKGTVAEEATVYLGIPLNVDAQVFTSNGIGDLIAQLFSDRLNNDYDFGAGASDNGYAIVDTVNLIGDVTPKLDDTVPYTNTAAAVETALGQAKTYLDGLATPSDTVDYLVDMMAVENPAYFDSSSYTGFGVTPPTGTYPVLAEPDARALLPAVADVDSLASGAGPIAFASPGAPGF